MIPFLHTLFRRHHHEPVHDGRLIDAGMRFLQTWESEDGWRPWRGAGDGATRTAVKALLGVKQKHATEVDDQRHGHAAGWGSGKGAGTSDG